MGKNLPPGVSVSDLPGNQPYPDEVPECLLCFSRDNVYHDVYKEDGDIYCEEHGKLSEREWRMVKI